MSKSKEVMFSFTIDQCTITFNLYSIYNMLYRMAVVLTVNMLDFFY